MMRRRVTSVLGFGLLALNLLSCDETQLSTSPATDVDADYSQVPAPALTLEIERARMAEDIARLAQSVATALGNDPELRQRLHSAIAESPFREQKLEFKALVREGEVGLGSAIAAIRGSTLESALAAIDSLYPLELYLPVKAHRDAWTGAPDLFVATTLDDAGEIYAYDLTGREVRLSHSAPPSTPTLALVPQELDFAQARADLAASASGSPARMEEISSDGSIFLTYSFLPDLKEPWILGDPEIYAFVVTRTPPSGGWVWTRCSGDAMSPSYAAYQFDQNTNTWTGSVKLAGELDVHGKEFVIQFWEIDSDRCDGSNHKKPKGDVEFYEQAVKDFVIGVIMTAYCFGTFPPGVLKTVCVGPLYLFIGALNIIPGLINDDYIGSVAGGSNCFPTLAGPVSFALHNQNGQYSGTMSIDDDYLVRELCPLSIQIGGDDYACTQGRLPAGNLVAVKNTSEGTYSYKWYEDGYLRGTASTYSLQDTSEGFRFVTLEVTRHWDNTTDTKSKWIPVYDTPPPGLSCDW